VGSHCPCEFAWDEQDVLAELGVELFNFGGSCGMGFSDQQSARRKQRAACGASDGRACTDADGFKKVSSLLAESVSHLPLLFLGVYDAFLHPAYAACCHVFCKRHAKRLRS
jgi:hypothetical protein